MIFKTVLDEKPYPFSNFNNWSDVAPKKTPLCEIIVTQKTLSLEKLLNDDSTFFGDLFPHVIKWKGELYLDNGVHRALRAALGQQEFIHARVLTLSESGEPILVPSANLNF